jgi:hypothetical protein
VLLSSPLLYTCPASLAPLNAGLEKAGQKPVQSLSSPPAVPSSTKSLLPLHSLPTTFASLLIFFILAARWDIVASLRTMAAAAVDREPRERKPSVGAPISTLVGPVGPGFSRPKHKRTATGFGPADIKGVEASIPEHQREA